MAKRPRMSSTGSNFTFTNAEIQDNLLPRLQEMRKNKELCDIEIKVGNRSISAHRNVLAATIPYFSKMFKSKGNDKRIELVLKEMDSVVIEKIVDYSYTGEVEIESRHLKNFVIYAKQFDLPKIFEKCVDFMIADLSLDTVFKYTEIGKSVGSESLIEATENYVCKKFSQVVLLPEFLKFSFEELSKLIANDDLNVTKEEVVYEAVMRWVKFDRESRFALFPQIFNKIRLTTIQPEYLFDVISAENLIQESLECRKTLDEVKKYHIILKRNHLPLQLSNAQPRKSVRANIETIYVLCGSNLKNELANSVMVYKNGQWRKVSNLVQAKKHFQATALNGKIYIIGGMIGREYSASTEIFDPKTNKWSEGTDLSQEIYQFGVATLHDSIYVCGGILDSWRLTHTECLSESNQVWEAVAPMSTPRSSHIVVSLNGYLYVLGGIAGGKLIGSCERYCPVKNEWNSIVSMAVPKYSFGCAVFNGKIYVCGGRNSIDSYLNSCEVYDPESNSWSNIAPLQENRSNLTVASCNGKLYAIAGFSKALSIVSVEEYCPEKDEWKFVSPFPNKASDLLALTISNLD